jgi:hypothetical protein
MSQRNRAALLTAVKVVQQNRADVFLRRGLPRGAVEEVFSLAAQMAARRILVYRIATL